FVNKYYPSRLAYLEAAVGAMQPNGPVPVGGKESSPASRMTVGPVCCSPITCRCSRYPPTSASRPGGGKACRSWCAATAWANAPKPGSRHHLMLLAKSGRSTRGRQPELARQRVSDASVHEGDRPAKRRSEPHSA